MLDNELKPALKNEIVVYQPDDTLRLDVALAEETVWLTQSQMTELFQRDRTVITRHINNAFREGELDEKSNVHFLHIAKSDKPVKFYSLNVVISVGYRVKSVRGTQFRIWATGVLRDYLLRGYALNVRMSQLEERVDRRIAAAEHEVGVLKRQVAFAVESQLVPDSQIFYQGQFWDAKSLLVKFIRRAKKELVIVDAYPGVATLDMLAKRTRGVKIEIITHSNGELAESDFEAFGRQYGKLTKTLCGICHDRFIIVDGKEIYAVGASLKDAGRQTFGVVKSGPETIPGLLANLRKAATGSRTYG